MGASDPVVVPGWLGRARMVVPEKGRAYTFGAFMVSADEVAFSDETEMLLRLSRDETTIEWPRLFMGAGLKLEGGGIKEVVFFGRPFPTLRVPIPSDSRSRPAPSMRQLPDWVTVSARSLRTSAVS